MPSLVQIGQVVLEKKIFKYFHYNFTFLLLSPLLVEIGPVVLEKKLKCEKFTDEQTDDIQQTTGNQKSSLKLSAQVS